MPLDIHELSIAWQNKPLLGVVRNLQGTFAKTVHCISTGT